MSRVVPASTMRDVASITATTTTSTTSAEPADAWKDSTRVAQFVANVVGGLLVVVGLSSYVGTLVWHTLTTAPTLREFGAAHLQHALVLLHLDHESAWRRCWTQPAPPTNENENHTGYGIVTVIDCLGLWRVLTDDSAEAGEMTMTTWSPPLRVVALVAAGGALGWLLKRYKWIGWYCALQTVVILQWVFAVYQLVRVLGSMTAYFSVKGVKLTLTALQRLRVAAIGRQTKHAAALRQLMKRAVSYHEWRSMASYLDELEGHAQWKTSISHADYEHCDFDQLQRNTEALQQAMATQNVDALRYILTSYVMRNKLGIDSASLHLECQSGTKQVIAHYNTLVVQALELVARAPPEVFPMEHKTAFFRELKQSFGATALCLSGGGAIAMYHMGVLKALLQADLLPNVISGSSGGAIAAAMTACKTNAELLATIIQRDVSTRYFRFGVWWFPPLVRQLAHCVKTGFLVECSEFERTTKHYYGEPMDSADKMMHYTFQDAFLKTGRHVCITVSASEVTGHKGPKKLLLNHINTPHVLLWSAVAVSCSLPGIMKGKKLMARDHEGNVVPYDAMGREWMDGSLQHDLPMETMASCFNVTNFIVSQVNPHVVPFVSDDIDTPNVRKSLFHTLESLIAGDVRHRLKMLAFLGLFPKIYGHQFSSYFKQNFSGHVTLIPDFIFLEAIGIKAILNPTCEDMDRYILGGQRAVWPKLAYIGHLCAIEKCVDGCLEPLVGPKVVRYNNWLHPESERRRDALASTGKTG